MALSVITPTADRPFAMHLCERWMARQTVQPDEWIVADGGMTRAELTMGQIHVHNPAPPGAANFTTNMLAAIDRVGGSMIVCVENDDWYASDHLERCVEALQSAPAYGCTTLAYYHVGLRRWRIMPNRGSSMAQTALRAELLPDLRRAVQGAAQARAYNVDGRFWRGREALATGRQTVVGIKGLPGAKGLGVGHREARVMGWPHDPDGAQLRKWLGQDADAYSDLSAP